MKKLFTLLLFITILQQIHAQQSLDSLRLVLPTFHQQELGSNMFTPLTTIVSKNEKYVLSHEPMNGNSILWEIISTKR